MSTLEKRLARIKEAFTQLNRNDENELSIPITVSEVTYLFRLQHSGLPEEAINAETEVVLAKYEGQPMITLDEWSERFLKEKEGRLSWRYSWEEDQRHTDRIAELEKQYKYRQR